MSLFNGHFEVTPKSLGAILLAIVGIALAWGLLTPDEAASVSALVSALCAVLVPRRAGGEE